MGQPVKLSDTLVADARTVGALTERSIASQIEYWAALGKALEPLVALPEALALKRAGAARPLSALIGTVDSAQGRARVAQHLAGLPYPHYEAARDGRALVRIDANGTRTVGRFARGQFRPILRSAPGKR